MLDRKVGTLTGVEVANFTKRHIIFVGDKPKVRKMVDCSLQEAGFDISCHFRISSCIEQLRSRRPCDLFIFDVKMPRTKGIETLTKVKCVVPSLPVLVIIGHGDVTTAATAIKAGASDVIEKPLNKENFLSVVELTLKGNTRPHPLVNGALTNTEMGILFLILDGKSNKEIAYLLHRSVRTIEVHRSHIMRKLGVDNVVHLVEKSIAMGLIELHIGRY
ncbi:MAG: response regulator transcription factor [Planctomycetota bacterium]